MRHQTEPVLSLPDHTLFSPMTGTARVLLHQPPPSGCRMPAPDLRAGEKVWRFSECLTATIRQKNTRAAYVEAIGPFFRWCDRRATKGFNDPPREGRRHHGADPPARSLLAEDSSRVQTKRKRFGRFRLDFERKVETMWSRAVTLSGQVHR